MAKKLKRQKKAKPPSLGKSRRGTSLGRSAAGTILGKSDKPPKDPTKTEKQRRREHGDAPKGRC